MFSHKVEIRTDEIEAYLENIPLPKLTSEQALSCEGIISKDEVFNILKSIKSNKSLGNNWDEIKNTFLASIHKAFLNQKLNSS